MTHEAGDAATALPGREFSADTTPRPHLIEITHTEKQMNLKEKIERARAEAKEREAKRPPEPTLKVKGFWQKKTGDNDTHSSFVAKVTGIGYDQERDRETLT